MTSSFRGFLARFSASRSELAVVAAVFLATGVVMNSFGKWAQIAEFKYWWQVATCYLGYVVPLALFIRGWSFPQQLVVCIAAFLPLEIGGYAIGSSIAHEGNVFESAFGERNFVAVMVLSVAFIPPIGLRIALALHRMIVGKGATPD